MKIAYCSNVGVPTRAAEGVDTVKRCQWFSKLGHDVILLAPGEPDPEGNKDLYDFYGIPNTFPVVRLPWFGLPGKRLVSGYLAARRAKQKRVDLVYARSIYASLFAVLLGIDTVVECHTPIIDAGVAPDITFRGVIRSAYFRRLVVITKPLKKHFSKRYKIPEENIMVASEAADDFSNAEPIGIGTENDRFTVGYIGSLYPGKGMEVICQLAERCSWADFHCVGGTDEDIQRWKEKVGEQANVVFHGYVQPSEVARYCQSFDVLIAPYQREISAYDGDASNLAHWTSPLKLFEYMSAGQPIVCSDLPVLHEVMEDGHNALLCDPDQIDEWVRALEQLRDNEDLRAELSSAARREYEGKYTWEARAEKVLSGLDAD